MITKVYITGLILLAALVFTLLLMMRDIGLIHYLVLMGMLFVAASVVGWISGWK